MENISINDFKLVTSSDGTYILLSLGDGQGGRIAAGTLTEQIKPSIQNGVWFIGSKSTDITAQGKDGKSIQLRQGVTGIEWAYVDEENWTLVVPYSELKLDFDDLTEEQKGQLKMTLDDLSAEDIALLQQPANDMIATLESTNTQMQASKNDAQDTADHPTYIGVDYFVYKWNKSTKVYEKTSIYVKGEDGLPPTLQLGDVTTLDAGANASANITPNGTTADGSPIYKIDLSLPRGAKGENGSGSGNVLVSTEGLAANNFYLFTPSQNNSAEGMFMNYELIRTPPVTEQAIINWGFTKNTGTITEVKMNNVSKGTSGVVDLGNVLTEAPKVSIVNHGTADTTLELTPNVLHKWGEVLELSLSLPIASTTSVDFFMVEFVSGATATTLTLPESVKFNAEVSIEPNKTYQISIVNNLGVIGGF